MRPVFFCKCRKFCTVCRIGFLFGKVYVVQQGLDVKSGSAGDNRDLPDRTTGDAVNFVNFSIASLVIYRIRKKCCEKVGEFFPENINC